MNVQHLEVSAGEDRTLMLYARDADNLPVSLTAKSIGFYVGRSPWHPDWTNVLITKTGTVTDASAGEFTVPIVASDTTYRGGDYEYIARSTDNATGSIASIARGRFRIIPTMVT